MRIGAFRPRIGTEAKDSTPSILPAASCTDSETRKLDFSSLFNCSIRNATFTTSPITVYSRRSAEPILPTTTSPVQMPMPRWTSGASRRSPVISGRSRRSVSSATSCACAVRHASIACSPGLTWHPKCHDRVAHEFSESLEP